MKQAIVGYHKDDDNDWVAQLHCGHFQHVRHIPMLPQYALSGTNSITRARYNMR
jgi:hypothetical protein